MLRVLDLRQHEWLLLVEVDGRVVGLHHVQLAMPAVDDVALPGFRPFHTSDPIGTRLELSEPV